MAVQISNIVFLNLLYCYISVSSPKPPSQCNMKKDSYISFTLCNSRVISKWDLGKCRLCLEKMNPAMLVVGSVLSACWSPLLKWIKREEENSTARALRKSHKIHIWVDHPIYLPKVINSQIRHASSCQLTFENWITWEHDKERWAIALHKQADVRKTRAALCSFHVTGVGDNRQGENNNESKALKIWIPRKIERNWEANTSHPSPQIMISVCPANVDGCCRAQNTQKSNSSIPLNYVLWIIFST